jgi:hypothetical protein
VARKEVREVVLNIPVAAMVTELMLFMISIMGATEYIII